MPQLCNNMAGHSDCAESILRASINQDMARRNKPPVYKGGECPGSCVVCVSRYKDHPEAVPSRVVVFMQDPACALRYIGHHKNERSKRKLAK